MNVIQGQENGVSIIPSYPKVSIVLRAIFYISTEEEMRKFRFLQALESELPNLRNLLRARKLAPNDVDAILSDAVHGLVTRKDHNKFQAETLKASLRRAVLWQAHKYHRDNVLQAAREIPLADPDQVSGIDDMVMRDREMSEDECPFCHAATLNVHGACAQCHTIVPRSVPIPRPKQNMDELTSLPDYEMTTDVKRALEDLPAHEKLVVEAVIMGNESLESLGALTGTEKTVLWRRCMSAFSKLRAALRAYKPKHRDQNVFPNLVQNAWSA